MGFVRTPKVTKAHSLTITALDHIQKLKTLKGDEPEPRKVIFPINRGKQARA